MDTIHNIKKILKSFSTQQELKEIFFTKNPREIIGLVGENGAGKSTLLKILATIDRPDSGSISLNNMDYIKDNKTIRKTLGFVPQEIEMWQNFSVEENMIFLEK